MLTNYLRIALRNLRKHSFYAVLNVFGLSLGIACGLILLQFIHYHLSYDGYHRKAARLYRVVTDLHLEDGSVRYEPSAPLALAAVLRDGSPLVKDQAYLFDSYRNHVYTVEAPGADPRTGTDRRADMDNADRSNRAGNAANRLFAEHGNVAFADRHWFNLFDYQWVAGDPHSALEQPNTAVLTERQAEKYFGKTDPIGKTLRMDGDHEVKITGLLKDPPANTFTAKDVYISLSSLKSFFPRVYPDIETSWGWINRGSSIYFLLPDKGSVKAVDDAIAAQTKAHMGESAKYFDFHLQPLTEVHFDGRYGDAMPRSLLSTLGIVGFFILLIACVNFINLATAQNSRRIKEISTRKILGSSAAGIFWQFVAETACIALSAILLSSVWISLAMPVLNQWLQIGLEFRPFRDGLLLIALLSLLAFIVVVAGCYPALLLSRYKPVEALGNRSGTAKQPRMRRGLIILQNVVAQALIISTLIITLQTNWLRSADLGFNKEAVVMVPVPASGTKDLGYLREQWLHRPHVKDASFCFRPPASETFKAGSVAFDNRGWEKYTALCILGDSHYLTTFGLQLLAGRNIVESDTVREFLITEDFVRKLGFTSPSQVLGHRVVAGALDDHPGTIVGVIKDIHLHSLHEGIEPLVLTTQRADYAYAGIKINGGNPAGTIDDIKKVWQQVYPGNVFEYHFLDEQIGEFYRKEALLNKLIGTFAVVAILISCMGLLGLISLLTVQRTKEIGIRKVVGASVANITVLLSKDTAKLVGLALVFACIAAWFFMSQWLQGFAYRINMPWWVFLVAGFANLVLALLTIGYHSVRAALMNPVKSLRTG